MKCELEKNLHDPVFKRAGSVYAGALYSSMPLLSHMRVKICGGRAAFTATDLEITASASFAASEAEDGEAAVPGKPFLDFVRSAPGGKIEMALSPDKAFFHLKSGGFKVALRAEDPADLPDIGPPAGACRCLVGSKALLDAYEKTARVCMKNDQGLEYRLGGVLFDPAGDELNIVACDKDHVMVRVRMPGALEGLGERFLISKKGFDELAALAANSEEVALALEPGHLAAEAGDALLRVRLLEGGYFDYASLFPDRMPGNVFRLDTRGFDQLLKRMAMIDEGAHRELYFRYSGGGAAAVECRNFFKGRAEEDFPVAAEGPAASLIFDRKLLAGMVGTIKSQEFKIFAFGPEKPVLITADGDPGFAGLMTQIRDAGVGTPQIGRRAKDGGPETIAD